MCGLVALFNKNQNGFTQDQKDVFTSLLFLDFLRGPDSTGAFVISNRGDLSLAKEASDSLRFMRQPEYKDLLQKAWMNGSAMIGHNRKATRGVVNDANAHPFVVDDNIVLVHNGTMWGDHKKIADVEVDSHAIAHTIHEHDGDVAKALSSFDAAYALIWYNVKDQVVNLVRNSHRPLWWVETTQSWLWASEKCMLDFVIDRHDLKVKDGPHELPEDVLQTYTLQNGKWDVSDQKLTITKRSYNYNSQGNSGYSNAEAGGHRRHPYANAWGDSYGGNDDDDIPFRSSQNEVASYPVTVRQTPPPNPANVESAETYSTSDPPGTLGHFEREMCKKAGVVITNNEWKNEVIRTYPHGCEVIAEAFEYTYVNGKDPSGGFYLYCRVCDDRDIIVRQWFTQKNMDEERIIQIAGTNYVYKFVIDRKQWRAYAPGAVVGMSAGFAMFTTQKATLLYGGGIGDAKYAPHKETIQ